MELKLGPRTFPSGEFAIMTSGLTEPADIAELPADPALIGHVRAERPQLVIAVAPRSAELAMECVSAGADLLVGDEHAPVAAVTGAGVVCSDPGRADGVRRDGILVESDADRVADLLKEGLPVLVTPAGTSQCSRLAATAAFARLGVQVFRTASEVRAVRKVLDLIASGAV